jgi:hypothetical protein
LPQLLTLVHSAPTQQAWQAEMVRRAATKSPDSQRQVSNADAGSVGSKSCHVCVTGFPRRVGHMYAGGAARSASLLSGSRGRRKGVIGTGPVYDTRMDATLGVFGLSVHCHLRYKPLREKPSCFSGCVTGIPKTKCALVGWSSGEEIGGVRRIGHVSIP